MLHEAREVFAARGGIGAVVVRDGLHGGVREAVVLVEDVFGDADVCRRRKRIPSIREALTVVSPVHLHQANVEVRTAVADQIADRAIRVFARAKEEAATGDVQRPRPCATVVCRLIERDASENFRIDGRVHGVERRLRGCACPAASPLCDARLSVIGKLRGAQPPGLHEQAFEADRRSVDADRNAASRGLDRLALKRLAHARNGFSPHA